MANGKWQTAKDGRGPHLAGTLPVAAESSVRKERRLCFAVACWQRALQAAGCRLQQRGFPRFGEDKGARGNKMQTKDQNSS